MVRHPSPSPTVQFATAYIPVLENIASSLDLKEVLTHIVDVAIHLSDADKGSILLLDEETGELYLGAAKGFDTGFINSFPRRARAGSIEEGVIKLGLPVLISSKSGRSYQTEVQDTYLANSLLSFPIKRGKSIYGILSVFTTESPQSLTESDYRNTYRLADYTAIAIANARRYRETDHLLGDAYVLFDMAETLTGLRDLNELLGLIARHTLERLEAAERVAIHLLDPNTGRLERKICLSPLEKRDGSNRAGEFTVSEPLLGQVLQKNRTLNISQVEQKPFFDARTMIPGSLLVSPISGRKDSLGTVSVSSRRENIFRLRDERFLSSLANLAAVAIENIRLFEAERARFQELRQARHLQDEAEKIAAMGDIASNILHKVNGLVSGIRLPVQSTREKLSDGSLTSSFLSERLAQIEETADMTIEITQSIHKPFEPLVREPIGVNACLIVALKKCKYLSSAIELNVDLDKTLPPVTATQQLDEVFQNLLNNAIEAMQGKGKLQITSRQVGQAVEIAVTDSGPGLGGNLTAANIFDLGKSTKKDRLGYGLWWCKIYLNRIGGSIRLDTDVASGCRFVVKLPLKYEP